MSLMYEAAPATQLHGRGTGVIVLVISVVALLLLAAIAADFHGFAQRVPWAGRSSDPEQQRFVVGWNRVGCGIFAIFAVIAVVDGIRLISTGSM
ncbi:hypothetical protein KDL01_00525 [Actinospica durhamensis]|uniref:Uncharacterized protein n=1 Tax=Actinospica durhamensis TaxID=1508375 RepID=A0A941IKD3_9ACTN|nr:hypothetical protein [Actinospica durhamensis]MBR7831720.1 hypothetical protein [Actinospica durhamensis]